jgi:hypothetical protein
MDKYAVLICRDLDYGFFERPLISDDYLGFFISPPDQTAG